MVGSHPRLVVWEEEEDGSRARCGAEDQGRRKGIDRGKHGRLVDAHTTGPPCSTRLPLPRCPTRALGRLRGGNARAGGVLCLVALSLVQISVPASQSSRLQTPLSLARTLADSSLLILRSTQNLTSLAVMQANGSILTNKVRCLPPRFGRRLAGPPSTPAVPPLPAVGLDPKLTKSSSPYSLL